MFLNPAELGVALMADTSTIILLGLAITLLSVTKCYIFHNFGQMTCGTTTMSTFEGTLLLEQASAKTVAVALEERCPVQAL
jgi:hypothetical protein